jgi:hypothetical protein
VDRDTVKVINNNEHLMAKVSCKISWRLYLNNMLSKKEK